MKCSQCNRQFATRAALLQHARASHEGANPSPPPPPSKRRNNRKARGARGGAVTIQRPAQQTSPQARGEVEAGSDIITVVSVKAESLKPGTLLNRTVISPRKLQQTRLWQQALMWIRWYPLMLRFRVSSTCPSTGGGLYGVAWSADADDTLPVDPVALARKMAILPHFRQANFWEHASISVNDAPVQRWLYTVDKAEDSDHGCFILVVIAPPLAITGSISFTVELDWRIRFDGPDIDIISSSTNTFIRADAGYDPFYSTASVHLDIADKLTLECTAAGGYSSIARFTQAMAGHVYEAVSGAITVWTKGKTTPASEENALYIVRMKERPEPFMWVFSSKEDAKAYAKTGDVTKLMPYVKSGDWTTPGLIFKDITATLDGDHSNVIPNSLRVSDQDTANRLVFGDVNIAEFMSGINASLALIQRRLSEMSTGTTLDPFKVFVEDPVPLAGPSGHRLHQLVLPSSPVRTRTVSVGTDDFEICDLPSQD